MSGPPRAPPSSKILSSRAVNDSGPESAPEYDFEPFGDSGSGSGSKGVEPLVPISSLVPIPILVPVPPFSLIIIQT